MIIALVRWMLRRHLFLLKLSVVLLMLTCIFMAFYITVQSEYIDLLKEELDSHGPYIEDIPGMLEQEKIPI